MLGVGALAREIARRHRLDVASLEYIAGRGTVNHVFVARTDVGSVLIRFPRDRRRGDEYEKESWCLAAAALHGIPSPKVLARSSVHDVAYLLQTFVAGASGSEASDPWGCLADYAVTLHQIGLSSAPQSLFTRFGRDVSAAWALHLRYNLESLDRDDPLLELAVYDPTRQAELRGAVARLMKVQLDHGLIHGDLSPRNLIVPTHGPPVLIDWGTASTGPVPHGELVAVLRDHVLCGRPTTVELDVFARGMGISAAEDRDLLADLLVLGALDLVRWAIDIRPDRVREVAVNSRFLIQRAGMY